MYEKKEKKVTGNNGECIEHKVEKKAGNHDFFSQWKTKTAFQD